MLGGTGLHCQPASSGSDGDDMGALAVLPLDYILRLWKDSSGIWLHDDALSYRVSTTGLMREMPGTVSAWQTPLRCETLRCPWARPIVMIDREVLRVRVITPGFRTRSRSDGGRSQIEFRGTRFPPRLHIGDPRPPALVSSAITIVLALDRFLLSCLLASARSYS
jgi:hypothetical protein